VAELIYEKPWLVAVLVAVSESEGPVTAKELARRSGLRPKTAKYFLWQLERYGLCARVEGERRSYVVSERGLKLIERLDACWRRGRYTLLLKHPHYVLVKFKKTRASWWIASVEELEAFKTSGSFPTKKASALRKMLEVMELGEARSRS